MAGTPIYKVYTHDGEYIASVKRLTDGAIIVGFYTHGTVRYGHGKAGILWNEGHEAFSASQSCDQAAAIMEERLAQDSFWE